MLKRGFTAPLLLVLVTSFFVLASLFWVISNNVNTSTTSTNVKGASSNVPSYAKPGFAIYVSASQGTWDLVQYLCKDYDACVSSLDSGKRWGTVGGGPADLQEIFVEYNPQWSEYKYIKLYVRSSWGSQMRLFTPTKLGDVPDTKAVIVTANNAKYNVVVMPVEAFSTKFYKSAEFTDK